MTDAFQRRDDGGLYEVVSETDSVVTLRAYDEGHTISTVSRAEFSTHFDNTQSSLPLNGYTADGAGGIRLMCGEYVVHLTATSIAEIVTEAAV